MFEWLHWRPKSAQTIAKDKSSAQSYLSSCVARHIQEYRDRRDSNQKNAFFIKMFSVFVGAITTVVIGVGSSGLLVGGNYPQYASILALILTASVTVISAWCAIAQLSRNFMILKRHSHRDCRKCAATRAPSEGILR
jgi:Na+/pantothenate symporter